MAEIAALAEDLRVRIIEAYELWWNRGADHIRGGFHERLNQDGTSTDEPRRARLHPRQIFAYSHAPKLGWQGPAGAAVEHALQFFLSHYRREDGLFRPLVSPAGKALSGDVVLYDQTFALLGLASAYSSSGDTRLRQLAVDLHDRLRARLAHAPSGFKETFDENIVLSSNSHMHLFEACLAWIEIDQEERWVGLAQEVIELVLTRFIDHSTGAIREYFDGEWQPAPGEPGSAVEPGHQFEWAWLLLRFHARMNDRRLVAVAQKLIDIGETHGVDRERRVAIACLDSQLDVRDGRARLWSQCERIKAASIALEITGEPRYQAIVIEATRTLLRYLDTPLHGLWRDCIDTSGAFIDEPAPASSFYHIVGTVLELLRIAPLAPSRNDSRTLP